jgi:HAD superfamily hydrolase (TIGR01509 family)
MILAGNIATMVKSGPLLLDFDGPMCSIFAGYRPLRIAGELMALLRSSGARIPAAMASEQDPLEILRWTGATCPRALTVAVEDALSAAELRAAGSAEPTPYSRETILAARHAGLPVAIVSNNSARAITAYLAAHKLTDHVASIIGRTYAEPTLMKPSPAPILAAARALAADPVACILIGDSRTDIEAARAAGVRVIGFANRPGKAETLKAADAVVTSMADIASALSLTSSA